MFLSTFRMKDIIRDANRKWTLSLLYRMFSKLPLLMNS